MGGFGSLMLAFRNPELFSSVVSYGAALISSDRAINRPGTFFTDEAHFSQYDPHSILKKNLPLLKGLLAIRIVCGDKDNLFPNNLEFVKLLENLNVVHDWVVVPGIAHDTRGLYREKGIESLKFIESSFLK